METWKALKKVSKRITPPPDTVLKKKIQIILFSSMKSKNVNVIVYDKPNITHPIKNTFYCNSGSVIHLHHQFPCIL